MNWSLSWLTAALYVAFFGPYAVHVRVDLDLSHFRAMVLHPLACILYVPVYQVSDDGVPEMLLCLLRALSCADCLAACRGCLSCSLWCKHLPSGTKAVYAAQKAAVQVIVINCPNKAEGEEGTQVHEGGEWKPRWNRALCRWSLLVYLLFIWFLVIGCYMTLSEVSVTAGIPFWPPLRLSRAGGLWVSGWSHFLLHCVNMWMYSKLSEKKGREGFWKAEMGL